MEGQHMPTSSHRPYTFIERVICNPIGLLLIIGLIVVVVTLLMGASPDTLKP
jgi:hypothetical protein